MDVLDETSYRTTLALCVEEVDDAKARQRRAEAVLLGALIVIGGMAAALWHLGTLPKIKPYYIVEQLDGRGRILGPAPETWNPRQETIKENLRQFVTILRRVSVDKKLMADDWAEEGIYAHVTARGRKALNAYVTQQDPLHRKDIVDVKILSVLPRTDKTYEVRWTEKHLNARFEPLEPEQGYRGLCTWVRQDPTTEAEIQHNSFGIFIDQCFSWEKE